MAYHSEKANENQDSNEGDIESFPQTPPQQNFDSKVIPPLFHCTDKNPNRKRTTNGAYQKKKYKRKYTTGYGIFFREKYREIQKIDTSIDFGAISKSIAATWRNMVNEERKK